MDHDSILSLLRDIFKAYAIDWVYMDFYLTNFYPFLNNVNWAIVAQFIEKTL